MVFVPTTPARGATSITSTGTVTGTSNDGIFARNRGTDLTINTAAVTGRTGITASNRASGATTITSTGTITGTNIDGIKAKNGDYSNGVSINGTDLTINTATVIGGRDGIYARNDGSGTTAIASTGTVTAGTQGIYAYSSYGTDITINTVAVTGISGITASNYGSGATKITSTGPKPGHFLMASRSAAAALLLPSIPLPYRVALMLMLLMSATPALALPRLPVPIR